MAKKNSIAMLVIASWALVCSNAIAYYQFDDFSWGTMKSIIEDRVRDKKGLVVEKDEIRYDDAIYSKPCRVILYFTRKSKELAGILVIWQQPAPKKEAKQSLVDRYGPPNDSDGGLQQYQWYSILHTEDDKLVLNCGPDYPMRLFYYGGSSWRKYIEENR